MEHGGDPIAGQAAQRFDAEEESGGQEDDCEREEDDVPARRAAHREELDVPREEVEERLRDRQRRESGEVDPPPSERTGGSGGRNRTVENPRAGREGFAALDAEALLELPFERLCLVVGVRPRRLAVEESPDHWIVAGRELDHDLRPQLDEPVQEGVERDVAGERDVVDERQAERQVRRRRSASGGRSSPRQPRPGDGSVTLPTSGRMVVEPSARSAR